MLFFSSKVTAPQDAHKQFSGASFPGSNTLEFSGTYVKTGFSKMQFIATYEQHKTCMDLYQAPSYCVIIFDKMWGKHYLSMK